MSKIIKSSWVQTVHEQQKIISIKMLQSLKKEDGSQDLVTFAAAEQKELLSQAYSKAEMIVIEAEQEAESIRTQIRHEQDTWEQEKARLSEEAEKKGFLKGINDGKTEGYQEYRDKILFAQEIIHSAKKDYETQVGLADKTILMIGMNAAEKILGEKLSENESAFLAIVKRALKEARDSREVQLHVHPCHYQFLLSQKDELKLIFPKETNVYIYPNDELAENSCFIESASGRIDASIDSQLEELKRKLLELLESESDGPCESPGTP